MVRFLKIIFLGFQCLYCIAQTPCSSEFQRPYVHEPSIIVRQELVRIPLVFHIVLSSNDQPITNEMILSQISLLNNAFQNKVQDITLLYPGINGKIGNVGFQFELVELDPQGSATDGIIRVETETDRIGDLQTLDGKSAIKLTAEGGSNVWDISSYVNVWIGNRTISLGSTITDNTVTEDIQGLVLDLNEVIDETKTIVHEMGHYFGLLHLWGNSTGCDDEGDGISDTPFQAFPNFDCENIIECSSNIVPGNYMDFSADECMMYFTRIQSISMQAFASNYKSQLINNETCFSNNLPSPETIEVTYSGTSIDVYIGQQEENAKLKLFTFNGMLVRSVDLKGESYINFSTQGIPKGVYVLVLAKPDDISGLKIFIY